MSTDNKLPRPARGGPDALDQLFFEEIFEKLDEMEAIGKKYGCPVLALVVPFNTTGNAKFRLLRPGMSKQDLLTILGSAYDWAVRQIESDPRLKEG